MASVAALAEIDQEAVLEGPLDPAHVEAYLDLERCGDMAQRVEAMLPALNANGVTDRVFLEIKGFLSHAFVFCAAMLAVTAWACTYTPAFSAEFVFSGGNEGTITTEPPSSISGTYSFTATGPGRQSLTPITNGLSFFGNFPDTVWNLDSQFAANISAPGFRYKLLIQGNNGSGGGFGAFFDQYTFNFPGATGTGTIRDPLDQLTTESTTIGQTSFLQRRTSDSVPPGLPVGFVCRDFSSGAIPNNCLRWSSLSPAISGSGTVNFLANSGRAREGFLFTIMSEADIRVSKTVNDAQLSAGESSSYVITVEHLGDDQQSAAIDLRIADLLPAGITAGTPIFTSIGGFEGNPSFSGGVLTVDTLDFGQTLTMTLPFTVNADATPGSTITSTTDPASITMVQTDPIDNHGPLSASFFIMPVSSDSTAPQVVSIERYNPSTSPTNANSLTWRVTFDEVVTGVDGRDFTLTGPDASTALAVSAVNGAIWDVTASGGNLASFEGTVTLGFASDQNIQDSSGNGLDSTLPAGAANTYDLDNTPPTVAITGLGTEISGPVRATFTFSETVRGFALGDIAVGNGAASEFQVTTPGTVWTALITPATNGTSVTVDVGPGAAMDTAGNPNAATQARAEYIARPDAGVTVTETGSGTTVSEDGTVKDSYEVVLTSEPTHDVTIAVTSGDTNIATASPATLTFTPGNWNQPQSVTVTGVDDDIDQSTDRTVSISHVATSDDTAYGGIEVASVSVTVEDDDEAAVGFVEAASTVPERAGTHEVTLRFDVVSAAPLELRYSLSGTATAGRDFTAGDGVLRVPAQAREVTLPVTILDDGEQEADETVVVTLIEDRGGQYRLGSTTTHTLTITDDDSDLAERVVRPALARFGRTVGEQVLDAVTDRLGAARTPGFEGRFAGEALPDVICDDGKSAPDHVLEDDDRRRKCVGQGRYEPGSGRPADPSVAAWSNGLTGGPGGTPEVQAKETSDILPGTSFALTSETENGAALAFWGRGAQSGFSGRAGDLGLEGEVTSFMLGADQARDDWLFGLMLSRSRGEIDYTLGAASGEMETDLTALVPYMGWDVSDRLSVWGAAGLGSGDMRLRPEDGSEFRTDIDWGMAAAGADGALGSVAALGGAELRWLADALWTRTTSDAVPGLEATSGSTTRLRLGLESRWEHSFASAATLSPRLETGLRYDGGDAETGFGLEVGGGVEFTDPSRGLSLGLRGRTLALHQDGNFEDWGLALDLAYDPTPETKRGFAARLSHTFGGASSGGVDALLGPRLFPEASPTGGGDRSWSVEAAYGVSRGRGRVGSPYTTITAAGSGSATGARLGYRIEPDADHAADVNLDFWTEPPTAANDRASGGATLQWKW